MHRSEVVFGEAARRSPVYAFLDTLRSDFLKSYPFSQGDPDLQLVLQVHLRSYYDEQAGGPVAVDTNLLNQIMTDLHMPFSSHLGTVEKDADGKDVKDENGEKVLRAYTPEEAEIQFEEDLMRFRTVMTKRAGYEYLDTSIACICSKMIARDIYFQTKRREYRASDPHSSYFREYILRRKRTGSDAFDAVFANTAAYVETTEPNDFPFFSALLNLEAEWLANHEGLVFFPEPRRIPLGNEVELDSTL